MACVRPRCAFDIDVMGVEQKDEDRGDIVAKRMKEQATAARSRIQLGKKNSGESMADAITQPSKKSQDGVSRFSSFDILQ